MGFGWVEIVENDFYFTGYVKIYRVKKPLRFCQKILFAQFMKKNWSKIIWTEVTSPLKCSTINPASLKNDKILIFVF